MNNTIIDKLNSIITNNKLTHAYLFEVNNYDDDFKVILNFVKMILSNMTYDEVINSDINYFKQIDDNKYIDLFIVEPDGNNIKKNQMIDLMTEFNDKSFLNNKRIYIIKECDKLNASSNFVVLFASQKFGFKAPLFSVPVYAQLVKRFNLAIVPYAPIVYKLKSFLTVVAWPSTVSVLCNNRDL